VSPEETLRARRRRETVRRITEAARHRFSTAGYERTTIRAVAADAGVDPALVMHYFGSKAALYEACVRVEPGGDAAEELPIADAVLGSLGAKIGGMPEELLAKIRSMLTHEESRLRVLALLDEESAALAARLDGPDREARTALMLAANLGVTIARELLAVTALRELTPARVAELLRPAVDALARPPAEGDA
jgi:AcrR family transcriptional regulator